MDIFIAKANLASDAAVVLGTTNASAISLLTV